MQLYIYIYTETIIVHVVVEHIEVEDISSFFNYNIPLKFDDPRLQIECVTLLFKLIMKIS